MIRRLVIGLVLVVASLGADAAPALATGSETPCVYTGGHISLLDTFDLLTGRDYRCVEIFADAAPDWQQWAAPGAVLSQDSTYRDFQWGDWAEQTASARQLIITLNLYPSSENSDPNVLAEGAAGNFESYATTFAQNLVNAGLGNSIIRLAHEANGDWYADSIPNTPSGDANWVQFWRNTVIAMRAVPGAHFKFDWTVNPGYRNIPLSNWYPGDDVVDIIGVDAYDAGVPASVPFSGRWNYLYNEPDGIGAVATFAQQHGKPISIPEWGLGPAAQPGDGQGGDDPAYINGIASVMRNDNVAYESYFFGELEQLQLENSPLSLAAYIYHFGPHGDAVGLPTSSPAPQVTITGGPADASTITAGPVTFTFSDSNPADTPVCSTDGQPWRACSTASSDTITVAAGWHYWRVQVGDQNEQMSLHGRTFTAN